MTVADLIEVLKQKKQDDQIEYVICKLDTELVAVNITGKVAPSLCKMLKFVR